MKNKKYIFVILIFFSITFRLNSIDHCYCTTSDSRFFPKLINLIKSINVNDGEGFNKKILVFDLGLLDSQKEILTKLNNVYLRKINTNNENIFKYFQTGSNRKVRGWFAWKPIVIRQALDECPYILYLDAAMEVYKDLDLLFRHINNIGYFLVDTGVHNLSDRITKNVKDKVINKLDLNKQAMLLNIDSVSVSAGIQGLSRKYYKNYVMPVYECSKNLDLFLDDGSSKLGFGAGRHDQILFGIYANLNAMTINRAGWINFKLDEKIYNLHMHWDRKKLNKYSCLKY